MSKKRKTTLRRTEKGGTRKNRSKGRKAKRSKSALKQEDEGAEKRGERKISSRGRKGKKRKSSLRRKGKGGENQESREGRSRGRKGKRSKSNLRKNDKGVDDGKDTRKSRSKGRKGRSKSKGHSRPRTKSRLAYSQTVKNDFRAPLSMAGTFKEDKSKMKSTLNDSLTLHIGLFSDLDQRGVEVEIENMERRRRRVRRVGGAGWCFSILFCS